MSRDEIPISRPWLGDAEAEAAALAVRSGWVGQGPRVETFESSLADCLGAPHVVAVSSGTTALHLALLVAGIDPEAEVIVPALSFIASANAVRMCGARVVFADVDPWTGNLDAQSAAARVTDRTRAILVVHQLGLPADLDALAELATRHDLTLLEDAACALGSRYRGLPIGRPHSALCCFSFHPRKVITTGEGGAITLKDPHQAEQLRQLRNHGAVPAPSSAGVTYPGLGYNYRMSDIHAAVGLAQLERLDEMLAERQAIAEHYDRRLGDHPGVQLPARPAWATPNYQSYQVVLDPTLDASPASVGDALAAQSIATRTGLTALHLEPAYAGDTPISLPNTERLSRRGLFLPIYPGLTRTQQTRVCDALLAALA